MNENTYWNKKGKHQAEWDKLYSDLVPNQGYASTEQGELLRTLSNVYYDIYNNGGCNLNHGRNSDWHGMVYLLGKLGFKGYPMEKLSAVNPMEFEDLIHSSQMAIAKVMELAVDFAAEMVALDNPAR